MMTAPSMFSEVVNVSSVEVEVVMFVGRRACRAIRPERRYRGDYKCHKSVLHQADAHGLSGGGAVLHRYHGAAYRWDPEVRGQQHEHDEGERYEQVHSALIYVDAERQTFVISILMSRLQRHERVAYHLRQRQGHDGKIDAPILSEMKPTSRRSRWRLPASPAV